MLQLVWSLMENLAHCAPAQERRGRRPRSPLSEGTQAPEDTPLLIWTLFISPPVCLGHASKLMHLMDTPPLVSRLRSRASAARMPVL